MDPRHRDDLLALATLVALALEAAYLALLAAVLAGRRNPASLLAGRT